MKTAGRGCEAPLGLPSAVAIVTVGRDAIVVGCRRFLLLLFDKGKRFQQEELKIATGGGANFRLPWVGPIEFGCGFCGKP